MTTSTPRSVSASAVAHPITPPPTIATLTGGAV